MKRIRIPWIEIAAIGVAIVWRALDRHFLGDIASPGGIPGVAVIVDLAVRAVLSGAREKRKAAPPEPPQVKADLFQALLWLAYRRSRVRKRLLALASGPDAVLHREKTPGSLLRAWRLTGAEGLRREELTIGAHHVRVTISWPFPSLEFWADAVSGRSATGDPTFDEQIYVRGEREFRLRLTAPVRAEILSLVHERPSLRLQQGVLDCMIAHPLSADAAMELLERLRRLATALSRPIHDERLALLEFAKDRLPGVRIRALRALHEKYPEDPEALEAQRLALSDPDASVRVHAALHAGTEKVETIRSVLADPASSPLARRQALVALSRLGDESVVPQLRKALAEGSSLAVLAALAALQERGRTLPPDLEDSVLGCLENGNREIETGALRVLADFGTIRAVAPLLDHAARVVLGRRSDATAAARAIQARLGVAAPGALEIADVGTSGAVSVAGDAQGRVAIASAKKQKT